MEWAGKLPLKPVCEIESDLKLLDLNGALKRRV